MSTAAGAVWGGAPMNVSDYIFGSQTAFPSECYSSRAMRRAGLCPDTLIDDPAIMSHSFPGRQAGEGVTEPLIDGVSSLLRDAFAWGRQIGVKSCVGIESGQAIQVQVLPSIGPLREPLKEYYKGALEHITATYKSDMFWIWTSEGWEARKNATMALSDPAIGGVLDDFEALHDASRELNSSIELATGGWTLGPMIERSYFDRVLAPGG